MIDTVRWKSLGEGPLPGKLRLIDQTRLPVELVYVELDDLAEIVDAIKRLVVRGAPAIGCAAALGLAAVCQHSTSGSPDAFIREAEEASRVLGSSRPTAVNLTWALARCLDKLRVCVSSGMSRSELPLALLSEAEEIVAEDLRLCESIGKQGLALFEGRKGLGVLTHCNAGALATSDYGTALSPVYTAAEAGLSPIVYADETRPLLQGSRLTAWELSRAGIEVTCICDNMAGLVMREGRVQLVIVGADRIAANGDVANKIGTYSVAVLARHHGIPFYVAAPYSTIDVRLDSGSEIPIEQRDPEEVRRGFGRQTAPDACAVYNPAFDVTPAELVDGIITERGILRRPYGASIRQFMVGTGA